MKNYYTNNYDYYNNPSTGYLTRIGNRGGSFVIDSALTNLGFNGVEDVDWENNKKEVVDTAEGGKFRAGLRRGGYFIDAEIELDNFTGEEREDWQNVINGGFKPLLHTSRDISQQYGHRVMAFKDNICVCRHGDSPDYNSITVSLDAGATSENTIDWTSTYYSAADISAVKITENGTIIVFSRKTMVHYSTDNGATYTPCTVLDEDGSPYVYHTPINSDYPGGYWQNFNNFIESNGVLVYGNYTNSGTGSSPINLYYSIDDGVTWKVFYVFGQSQIYTDNGTSGGGSGGTLLGDPLNSTRCRHIHALNVGSDGLIYVCTGDSNTESQCHFFRCEYDSDGDSWTVSDLLTTESAGDQRMRATGMYYYDGYIYWGNDSASGTPSIDEGNYGIWRCAIDDINDFTKHERLVVTTQVFYAFETYKGVCIGMMLGGDATEQSYTYYISFNWGQTWSIHKKEENYSGIYAYYNEMYDLWVYINARVIDLGKTLL